LIVDKLSFAIGVDVALIGGLIRVPICPTNYYHSPRLHQLDLEERTSTLSCRDFFATIAVVFVALDGCIDHNRRREPKRCIDSYYEQVSELLA